MRAKRPCSRRSACGDDSSDNSESEDVKAGLSLKDRVCEELRDLQVFFLRFTLFYYVFFLNFNYNVCLNLNLNLNCSGQPTAAHRPL